MVWRKSIPGRGDGKCKGPVVRENMACLRDRVQASEARAP